MDIIILPNWEERPPEGGMAVVIDVIRFSTTLCALLQTGRREIWTAREPRDLMFVNNIASCDIFSELDFKSPGRRFDNSPTQALEMRDSERPAYVTTTSGSKALCACSRVSEVVVGCFANFNAVLRHIQTRTYPKTPSPQRGEGWGEGISRREKALGPLWLIPAAGSSGRGAIEDNLCAEAFRDACRGSPTTAVQAIKTLRQSPRISEFLEYRSMGQKDLDICLKLNGLPVIGQAVFVPPSSKTSTNLVPIWMKQF